MGEGVSSVLQTFWQKFCLIPNIFFYTVCSVTLVSVNHPTLLEDGVFDLRVSQEILDDTASFEMLFNPCFLQMFLQFSLMPLTYGTTM